MAGNRQGRTDENTVQIVISAADRASGVIATVGDNVAFLGGLLAKLSPAAQTITAISFAFNQVTAAIATVKAAFGALNSLYSSFIGINVQLEEQLLATQSTLAATNQIKIDGIEITDPTEKIKALEKPISEALEGVRRDSLELVGVTSDQLVPIFQLIAGESSAINATLEDTKDLTVDFAAALGTMNIPLAFARQEILSILKGQVNQDSDLAKSLGITNEQVALWRQQGTVVEELRTRLETFRAGNALAAQTIGGVTSNIQEVFETIARKAGEPLLDPLVAQIGKFYQFLSDNQKAFEAFFIGITTGLIEVMEPGIAAAGRFASSIVGLFKTLSGLVSGSLSQGFQQYLDLIANLQAKFIDFGTAGVDAINRLAQTEIVRRGFEVIGEVISRLFELAGQLKERLSDALGSPRLRELAGQTAKFIGNSFETIKKTVQDIAQNETLIKFWELYRGAVQENIGRSVKLIIDLAKTVKDIGGSVFSVLATFARSVSTVFSGIFQDFDLVSLFENVSGGIETAQSLSQGLGNILVRVFQAIADGAAAFVVFYDKYMKGLEPVVIAIGKAIITALGSGFTYFNQVRILVVELFGLGKDLLIILDTFLGNISRVNEASGGAGDSLDGLGEVLVKLVTWLSNVGEAVVKFVINTLRTLGNTVKETRQLLRDLGIIQEPLKAATQNTGAALEAASEALGGVVKPAEDAKGAIEGVGDSAEEAAGNVELLGDPIRNLQLLLERVQKVGERADISVGFDQADQLAALDAQLRDGVISQEQYNLTKNQLTREGLEEQLTVTEDGLRQLTEAFNKLTPQQKMQAQEIEDQITQIKTKAAGLRSQIAQSEIQDETIARQNLATSIDRANQQITQAETRRQIDVQKLVNAGLLLETEASEARLESTRDRLDEELTLEQQKLAGLKAIGGENQAEVAASEQRILDLTKSRLENERQLFEANIATFKFLIEDRAKAIENSIERESQGLREQLTLYEALEAALQTRNNLITAGKDLADSQVNLLSTELGVLAQLETSDVRRRKLNEIASIAKLQALREQQRIEEEIVRIGRIQNQIALERRDIENQIAIAKAQGQVARGEAEIQVARKERDAGKITQADFEAKELEQVANRIELGGLLQQRELIDRERAIQPLLEDLQDRTRENSNQAAIRQAQAAVIENSSPVGRFARRQEFQQDILGGQNVSQFTEGLQQSVSSVLSREFGGRGPGASILDQLSPDRLRPEDVSGLADRAISAQEIERMRGGQGMTLSAGALDRQLGGGLSAAFSPTNEALTSLSGSVDKLNETMSKGGPGAGITLAPSFAVSATGEGGATGGVEQTVLAQLSGVVDRAAQLVTERMG